MNELGRTVEDVLAVREMAGEELSRFHGFGGLHGGLLAATLLRSMRSRTPGDATPVELTTHFLRRVVEVPRMTADLVHTGRSGTTVTARAHDGDTVHATAHGLFATPRTRDKAPAFAPAPPPDVTDLAQAERFVVPPEFVPISTRMEIRPATAALPYSGGECPELCAWVRLSDPVADPWERLLVLADALAPSYSAVLSDLLLVPTARMTVRFTPAATAPFDWVLVRATTVEAQPDRWLTETVDVWDRDGALLATASQLRLVR